MGLGGQSLSSTPLARKVDIMKTFSTFFPHKTFTFFPSISQFPKLLQLTNLRINSVFTCAMEGLGHITSHVTTARVDAQKSHKQKNTQTRRLT